MSTATTPAPTPAPITNITPDQLAADIDLVATKVEPILAAAAGFYTPVAAFAAEVPIVVAALKNPIVLQVLTMAINAAHAYVHIKNNPTPTA